MEPVRRHRTITMAAMVVVVLGKCYKNSHEFIKIYIWNSFIWVLNVTIYQPKHTFAVLFLCLSPHRNNEFMSVYWSSLSLHLLDKSEYLLGVWGDIWVWLPGTRVATATKERRAKCWWWTGHGCKYLNKNVINSLKIQIFVFTFTNAIDRITVDCVGLHFVCNIIVFHIDNLFYHLRIMLQNYILFNKVAHWCNLSGLQNY